ncbi:MAG TPA: DNA polymerase III subunit alpha, partial [Pseudogracilibacillus sp.]|nr:DNA polymerase III subunit alpha [Pseudogracilibacillus sp.]
NNDGLKHLMNLSTAIHEGNLVEDVFTSYVEHTICIVHTEDNGLQDLMVEDEKSLIPFIERLKQVLGQNNVFVQVPPDQDMIARAKELEKDYHISFIAMHDVRYLNEEDYASFDCLTHLENKTTWSEASLTSKRQGKYVTGKDQLQSMYETYPQSMTHLEAVTKRCHISFQFHRQLLPQYPVPNEGDAATYLKQVCYERVQDKYAVLTDQVKNRLKKELDIIIRLGFADYFLIVADYVQYAKRKHIPVGPGRGSAAGSIVSYVLGITDVDPIQYNLLFERFLNPERVTMPDIDMDFSDRDREDIVHYVRQKYGDKYVAKIITFDTYGTRSIIRELLERMDIDPYDKTYIINELKGYKGQPLIQFIKENKSLTSYIKKVPILQTLFRHAIKLEGLPRHDSIHAAGIVLGKHPLTDYLPLMQGEDGGYVTQFPMNDLEQLGLLKMDILGLRNLSSIQDIVHSIERRTGERIHLNQLPENDRKTFQLLQEGKTNGIFQLESDGMKRVLKKLKPNSFEDIVALNALYRPGPMEFIDTFVERKHGKAFTYIHPSVKPILEETYGVLVYQEQIMQIAHTVAGFSLGQADVLRRAVSKKQRSIMNEQEKAFVDGAIQKGYEESIAREIFSWIVQFADYGFPKSHSVAYSKISYQLSFLKANYPIHFYTAMLNHVRASGEKVAAYVEEAKQQGIRILPPSINESYAPFTLEKGSVRIGLSLIKNVGISTVRHIVEERKNGKFTDLYDFCNRTNVKRNVLENLILVGAFDCIHHNRASLLASIDSILEKIELFGSNSLFDNGLTMIKDYTEKEDFTIMEKLSDEKQLLHLYVSEHPLASYRTLLNRKGFTSIAGVEQKRENEVIHLAGMIQAVRKITTKNGESMAFLELADETDTIDAVVFPKVYREVSPLLKEENIIETINKVSFRNGKKQLIINELTDLQMDAYDLSKEKLYIRLNQRQADEARSFLAKVAKEHPGNVPIIIYDPQTKSSYQLNEYFMIEKQKHIIHKIAAYFGLDHVALK